MDKLEIKYEPSDKDEEEFFLMYHMNLQPSEVKQLSEDYRRWLIGRFVAEKKMEHDQMEAEFIRRNLEV